MCPPILSHLSDGCHQVVVAVPWLANPRADVELLLPTGPGQSELGSAGKSCESSLSRAIEHGPHEVDEPLKRSSRTRRIRAHATSSLTLLRSRCALISRHKWPGDSPSHVSSLTLGPCSSMRAVIPGTPVHTDVPGACSARCHESCFWYPPVPWPTRFLHMLPCLTVFRSQGLYPRSGRSPYRLLRSVHSCDSAACHQMLLLSGFGMLMCVPDVLAIRQSFAILINHVSRSVSVAVSSGGTTCFQVLCLPLRILATC